MVSRRVELHDIEGPTREVVESVVWCTVATAGAVGRPRTRVMHPVWSFDGARPSALVTARRTPVKVADLAANRFVSCSYWSPEHHTAVLDAEARWLTPDELAPAWERIAAVPPPYGFDPAMIWPDGPAAEGVAMLRFEAFRIVTTPVGGEAIRWSMDPAQPGGGPT